MKADPSRPIVDPFGQDRVTNPRQVGLTLESLNGEFVERMVGAFERINLDAKSADAAGKAQLVVSPAPGYGKSHLIGRLFGRLSGRATLINVQPFENVELAWHSMALYILNEMEFPDGVVVEGRANFGKTQMELFAERVIRNLISRSLLSGAISHPDAAKAAAWVRDNADLNLESGQDEWSLWIRESFLTQLLGNCCQEMQSTGLRLDRTPMAWLKVLFHIATSPRFSEARSVCMAWLRGEPGDTEGYSSIGLGRGEVPAYDFAEMVNSLCKSTLRDFCVLSTYHRPFLFCFDQTENYATSEGLVGQFGKVLWTLLDQFPHHLTVVTANKAKWDAELWPRIDAAHQARIERLGELRGITAPEAKEFVQLRFKSNGTPAAKVREFGLEKWIERHFPKGTKAQMAPREFLRHCSNHWSSKDREEPKESLEEIFGRFCREHEANPKGLKYNPDVFRWVVRHPLALHRDLHRSELKDPKAYLEEMWLLPGKAAVRFNFAHANSTSHTAWRAIADHAMRHVQSDAVPVSKVVVFQTPELSQHSIPKEGWKVNGPAISSARQSVLDLVPLGLEDAAQLYAARELQLKVQAGDISGFTIEEVNRFLAGRLDAWRTRILKPLVKQSPAKPGKEIPAGPPKDLADKLRLLMKKEKFLDLEDALKRLEARSWKERLLELCDEMPGIQKVAHPNSIMLIWHG